MGLSDIVHIPNAIDHEECHIVFDPECREPSVVSMSHYQDWKGCDDAVRALTLLHESHPYVKITFFGIPLRDDNLPSWIDYYQQPSREMLVKDIYNRHAVYLAASWSEGWGLPPAEAMACGCAFVGTKIGGFMEFSKHMETALLSPPRDPESLYRNLVSIIDDPGLRKSIQKAGTSKIREFNWGSSTEKLETWMHSLLNANADN